MTLQPAEVLLIEDNAVTQEIVQSTLEQICKVHTAVTGAQAVTQLDVRHFRLILLDVNLPDSDGFELYLKIRELKRYKHTPILFLTARGEREDKVRGFSLGADDYIVKPFDLIEFKMRISAKLRNLQAQENMDQSETLRHGPFIVNVAVQKIVLEGINSTKRVLDLTANQFKVLFYLLQNHNRIVSRQELLSKLWGNDVHVSDRTIDTHIYSIRQELAQFEDILKSVHGKGYQLNLDQWLHKSA